MLSTWEERRRKSWEYYACLLLFIWPVLLIPFQLVLAISTLTVEALDSTFMYSILVIGLSLGCGARSRYRGINPSTRNLVNVNDGHYFERIGPDESDYP